MLSYAMRLRSRYDGLVVASFPDVPDAVGYGRDDEEAREEGLRALEAALAALAAAAGFTIVRRWTDPHEWFADVLMVAE